MLGEPFIDALLPVARPVVEDEMISRPVGTAASIVGRKFKSGAVAVAGRAPHRVCARFPFGGARHEVVLGHAGR